MGGYGILSQNDPQKKWLGGLFSSEESVISLIREGVSIEGTVDFGDAVVRLEGHLQGKMIGRGTLVIGEKGLLQGELQVGKLVLAGRMEGKVNVAEWARIVSTGKLLGTIYAPQLIIEEGGIFEGESKS
jgi:cytoskeletal protein CcmA (bactofilin family)